MRYLPLLALLIAGPAFAQAPRVGPLDARNALGEIASGGSGAQATARANLGLPASAATDATNAGNISSGTLPSARLPFPGLTAMGGVQAVAGASHQWISSIDTSGVPHLAQPAAADVSGLAASATTDTTQAGNISSGTLPAARLPAPSASALGGVQSAAGASHQWISGISTAGVPVLSQPAASDISGLAPSATTDTTNATNITTGTLPAGPLTGANASGANVAATGSNTTRTTANRAADVLNVKDGTATTPGANGDGQCRNGGQCPLTSTTTMGQGSTTLTVGSSLFAPGDVGKTVIIAHAAATPTTGSVTGIPVATPGSGYTSLPTCAVTGAGGASAICLPQGTVVSATVASGGTGCVFTGTQTFTIASGVGRWATVTGTVTAGSLTGALTMVDGGYFSTLPLLSGVFASGGGGCTNYPTVNLSIGMDTIAMSAYGAGYPVGGTTAALTGGSPSVVATLGTPVVYAPIPPLVTTIASYVSPTQVTTAASAITAVSGSQPLFWATDDSAAIQAVWTAANAQQKNVYFPSGDYFSGAALDPGPGNISIRGDGMYSSRLWYNAAASNLILNQHGTPTALKGSLQFEDFAIRGLLDFGLVQNGLGTDAIVLLNYSTLTFNRIHCYYTPNGCSAMESVGRFSATNTFMEYIDASSWRCRSCFDGVLIGNHFSHTDDDSIDWHQAPYIQSPGTIRQGLTVVGNAFEDAIPIHSLGARALTVTGNTCDRCKLYLVSVDHTTSEGVNQIFSIDVSNNIATNTMGRAPFNGTGSNSTSAAVIGINSIVAQAGANDPNFIPGNMFKGSGVIIPPYSYYNNSMVNTNDATVYPIPPASSISVHDNRIMRTLPAVEAYSQWGYGTPISERLGLGIDPPVTDIALRPTAGISSTFNALGSGVHDNSISSVFRGIVITGAAGAGPALSEVELHDNFIYDAIEYGIFLSGMTNENLVSIRGGRINSDPYRMSPGRSGVNGAWTFNYTDNYCINGGGAFIRVEGVAFENCYQTEIGGTSYQNTNNFAYGTFNTVGSWSSSNLGIAIPPFGGIGFHNIPTIMTPGTTPGNFGAAASVHVLEAATVPTSGFHTQGETIYSTNPAGCNCSGWSMITSGSTWVLGTDYTVQSLTLAVVTVVPTTGNSITVGNGTGTYVVNPAGTLAALTITLPVSGLGIGDTLTIPFNQAISALTVSPNSGQAIQGSAVSAAAITQGQSLVYRWVAAATWQRIQ